jgi:predicted nuclease of restriction endonuclease-like (RecB) superfamily
VNDINNITAQEFQQVQGIISLHRLRALQIVNNENLLTAWEVGAFVSARLKNSAWGSKTVMQLSEYLRTQDPSLRGYSRSNIYNMVLLYDTYSSMQFIEYQENLKLTAIVQSLTGQIQIQNEIVQPTAGQLEQGQIVQTPSGLIVQTASAQFPQFLNLTTLSNHFEILNTCKTIEEQIFYVLYSYKERLNARELKRCLKNNTFASLMGDKHNLSKGLKNIYPQAASMLKDTVFVDFLGLPQRHSEKRLQYSILDNMKDFVLELGKDFLFYDKEYPLQVGNSTFKVDLLFYHRGLQCLVAIELKTDKFKPEYMGQLEFYLEVLDRDVRRSNENPSIGILLCQEADRRVVEYAMNRSLSPTMIAEYERQLIPKEVLQRSLNEFCNFVQFKS